MHKMVRSVKLAIVSFLHLESGQASAQETPPEMSVRARSAHERISYPGRSAWLWRVPVLVLAALAVMVLALNSQSGNVFAHSGDTFGPACGAAVIDGEVNPNEWGSATMQTFSMGGPNITNPLTATLYVMNSAKQLYLGITIHDDEFSLTGQFLPLGDSLRIDIDNDHSGALFEVGDEVLLAHAGLPQFLDAFIDGYPSISSATADIFGGGTSDGVVVASRVGALNHLEIRHPLCSGDSRDYCLRAGDKVGFRLEYLDAQAGGSFGGSVYFPGFSSSDMADIVVGNCTTLDFFTYMPEVFKSAPKPPDIYRP